MAEIRFLPAHPMNPDQVHRLSTELAAARARGLDLGPRGPQSKPSAKRFVTSPNGSSRSSRRCPRR